MRRPLALLALLALGGQATPSRAYELEVVVGLDGVLQEETWAPVLVRVKAHPGEPTLAGTVAVDLGRDAVAGGETPVTVVPGQTTLARLVVPIGPGRSYQVRLLDAERRTVAETDPEVAGAILDRDDRLGLLVGADGLLALRASPQKGAPRLTRVSATELRPLPECVLDGLAAVVLLPDASGDLRDLARDRAVVDRLSGFVERGGTLVAVGGTPTPFWEGSPLEELLPLARQRARPGREPVATFEELLGPLALAPDEAPAALPILRVLPDDTAQPVFALGRSGDPLLIRRRLGRGQVLFLAFDPDLPALRTGARAGAFLSQLVPPRPVAPPRLEDKELEATARRAFGGVSPLTTTGVSLLGMALLGHVLLVGPVAILIGRRRGPWAALFAPGLFSLLVATGLFLAGAAARGEPAGRALAWSFRRARDPQSPGRLHLGLGLFAGRGERFRLGLGPGLVPLSTRRDALTLGGQLRAPNPRLVFQDGHPVSIDPVCVAARGLIHLELEGPDAPEPAPFERARLVPPAVPGGAPRLELRATAPEQSLHAVVMGPGGARFGSIPALEPGQTWLFDGERGVAPPRSPAAWEGDLWADDDPTPSQALLLQVAAQLEARRTASLASTPAGIPPAFPAGWIVRLDRPDAAPFTASTERGPLPISLRRITVWSVEEE